MAATIRVFRQTKKWKLGVQMGDAAEKSIIIATNPDRTIKDVPKIAGIIQNAIVKTINKKVPKAKSLAASEKPISKRVTAVWPGEIEEGDKEWLEVNVYRNTFGANSYSYSIKDEMSGEVVGSVIGADHSPVEATDKIMKIIADLIKRPIKDPMQVEMFAPPTQASRNYREEIRKIAAEQAPD
jgi:hypothetical protein